MVRVARDEERCYQMTGAQEAEADVEKNVLPLLDCGTVVRAVRTGRRCDATLPHVIVPVHDRPQHSPDPEEDEQKKYSRPICSTSVHSRAG